MPTLLRTCAKVSVIVAALAGLAACSQGGGGGSAPAAGSADTSQDAAAIRAGETQWAQDWKNHAVEPVVERYSHDADLMPPGMAPAHGADAIRAALTEVLADPKFSLTFAPEKVVVANSGDLAYTTGKYSQTATDPKTKAVVHETGTYVTVYHKAANGDWKAVADINTPGPTTP
jgi:uncharacterized protein (TIGR02246 family)